MKDEGSNRRSFLRKVAALTSLSTVGLEAFSNVLQPSASGLGTSVFAADEKKFVPVMLTPFTPDLKIDYDGLTKLIEFYRNCGVKGFFSNCLSSEMYQLDPEERIALVRHVLKQVNGALPVVATGSFGESIEDRASFAKRMHDTGVNAVILITSHFAKEDESDDVFMKNIEKFLKLTGNIPLGTYECPSPYKRVLTPATLKFLLDTNRFVYHKDTTLELDKIKAKLAVAKGSKLEFYDAHTPNTMYSLQAGARGMSAIAGNFYPDIFGWMCKNVNNPDKQEDVKWLQSELTRADAIISNVYPNSAKYFLQKRGLRIEPVSRTTKAVLSASEKQTLDGIYASFLQWQERLGMPAKF